MLANFLVSIIRVLRFGIVVLIVDCGAAVYSKYLEH
jgi:hypothetical protein